MVCLFVNFYSLTGTLNTDFILAICANQTLVLNYNPSLPDAAGSPVNIQMRNTGKFICQVGYKGININVTVPYNILTNLSDATCEKATFTEYILYGSVDLTNSSIISRLFNLTVDASDPCHSRPLNTTQVFHRIMYLEDKVPILPADIIASFDANKHNRNCKTISTETILFTAYAYIPI
ncbi:unnamed protein product [Adineta steineri]|uniref:Uncharacterized protein n=1 Tax=Adineta steineri TaxID=433720 RepID=A0A813V1K6_9BILA|nr:unnamed protein product [Adineta steineri]CAF3980681.1 unnamed protein product [Adineta steineri]